MPEQVPSALSTYIPRNVTGLVRETLADTPITIIQGARQVGKSTLVQKLAGERPAVTVSLDDPGMLAAAQADPDGFVEQGGRKALAIDELQRAPELVRALKSAVDADRRPGRFLVTGSADLLTLPGTSDSLAGRAETIPLYGFSQGELQGVKDDFVSHVLTHGDGWLDNLTSALDRRGYTEIVCAGGYPDALEREGRARDRWFSNYLTRIIQRDAAEVSRLQHVDRLRRLLRLSAANNAGELVSARLARDAGIPASSLGPYLSLLEHLYLVHLFPAWGHNLTKRVVARPKAVLLDTGLAAHLIGATPESLAVPTAAGHFGGLLEGFVGTELLKQQSWSETRYTLHHFRDRDLAEVDIVIETAAGDVIGVEVKAAKSVQKSDFRGLELLRERLGGTFKAGVLLHAGARTLSFGDRLGAVPLEALWTASGAA